MPSRNNTQNDKTVIIASYEALQDLLFGLPNNKSLEERNTEKLDIIYGPEKNVDYIEALKRGYLHNG